MSFIPRMLSAVRRPGTTTVLLLVLASMGCYGVQSRMMETPTPPDELYRCVQLELGEMGYALVGADRASGWVQAQKRMTSFFRGTVRAEIYATVIPDEGGGGSHLQLTENTYAEEDAEQLRRACLEE